MNDQPPLLRNLVLFGRMLRGSGVQVTTGQLSSLAEALTHVNLASREDVYNAAHCVLVNGYGDLPAFDRAFTLFWRVWTQEDEGAQNGADALPHVPIHLGETGAASTVDSAPGDGDSVLHVVESLTDASPEDGEAPAAGLPVWSAAERLKAKDFSAYTETDLADAKRSMAQLQWAWTLKRSRRLDPSTSGRRPDVRRTLRRSVRYGGELMDLAWRSPTIKRRSLVVLCDISGSMDRYSRLLLHFLHILGRNSRHVEVFVFGTRLTRITSELRVRDPDRAVAAVASEVLDWAGGTRIGEVLATFNRRWARRVLDRGAVVLLISDGWDRGDPDLLARELERLQRTSYRLIWLNPLLGSPDYEPATRGLKAGLPFVDNFLPIHNLASLQQVARLLNGIQDVKPRRGI